jgi:hypothetical protein
MGSDKQISTVIINYRYDLNAVLLKQIWIWVYSWMISFFVQFYLVSVLLPRINVSKSETGTIIAIIQIILKVFDEKGGKNESHRMAFLLQINSSRLLAKLTASIKKGCDG